MAKNAIIPVFIPHLGCPNGCVFCDQRSISGQTAPPRAEDVAAAVAAALDRLSPDTAPELAFYGGSFTAIAPALQEAYLSAAAPFLQAGKLSSIRVSTRPDAISAESLARLARFGVKTIELGAQSMDERVLAAAHRGHTADDTRVAARAIRAAGFSLILQMMVGLPSDSAASALQTAAELAALAPDGVRIYPTVVMEHTALAALWRAGRYTPISVEESVEIVAQLIDVFTAHKIPILRIGLNESETLASCVLAGAYHPALGERCYARYFLHRMRKILTAMPPQTAITVRVGTARASVAAGHRRENLTALRNEFPTLQKIRIEPTLANPDELTIEPTDAPR